MIPLYQAIAINNWEGIPLVQSGRGIVGYKGSTRYQRGYGLGSILRSIFRIASPVVRNVAKSAAKAVAKEGIESAALLGSDLLEGQNLKSSLKRRGKEGATKLMKKARDKVIPPHAKGYRKLENESDDEDKPAQKGGIIGYKRNKPAMKRKKRQVGFGRKKYKRTPGKRKISKKSDYLGLLY